MSFKSRFIGDKAFYKHTIRIMLPIVVQNGITQFVDLLDILKCIVGFILVKKGVWLRNIVADK